MSGPTSLQRAAPSCCRESRASSSRLRHHHHHHHRSQCHRHRHRCDVYHSPNGDTRSEPSAAGDEDATRLSLTIEFSSADDRIFVERPSHRHQHRHLGAGGFYGKGSSRECVERIDEDEQDVERLVDDSDIELPNDDDRLSWQFDISDVLTRRNKRDDHFRRYNGGGQRAFASNVFLLATAGVFLALAIVAPPVSGTSSEKDGVASRARMGGTGTDTALAPSPPNVRAERVPLVDTRTTNISGTTPGVDVTGSMDLLAALQLYNTTRTGVTQVPGLSRLKPAYYLRGEERDLRSNEASFERAAALLRRVPEFTVAAALRQEEANSGTIVAFSHGNNRYLELQSSGRKDELRLHYVSRRDGAIHVEAFPFRLADGAWHRVALSVSGSQVELLVDCHPLYRRLLRPGPPDTNFTLPQLQLWVGQRNAKHFLFKGAMQDVKLIAGPHGYLSQCPQLDSSCPTCGQFSILQNTVEQLMHNLNELTRRLAAAEGRISQVEECDCQKSCRVNGTVHEDGATWEKSCEQCSCVHGEIECRPTLCAPVKCKHPVIPQGQCCPICLKQCYLHGVIYDHGEKVSPRQCSECNCYDGVFTCQRFDTEAICPALPCPASEQISVAEECCKFCPGVDYCAKGHKCHANASCLNLQTTYACHCNTGFQGDGHKCNDVDECKQQGGSDGHHCNANTRCVNVVGGYTCECLPGYHRIDKFNCAEMDECSSGRHSCSKYAACVNTVGSYYCVCNDGYAGDGYTCKPVCEQSCQNGGECVSPGRCSCRRGYIGNSCELDLDECASDLHRCHRSSTCFNMPGWYYCRCKPGYRSALHESNQGTQCLDIDECNDRTIEERHTCHPSARCVNTEGGYECSCSSLDGKVTTARDLDDGSSRNTECRLSCWYEEREIANGDDFAPSGNSCKRCRCKNGVVTCSDPTCDCATLESRGDKCCPQCDPQKSCRHQELRHLVFRSGERWIYQCQTCECLYGEIDCWQMECPPVTCSNPVTEDGDCCPRCEDDPCARTPPSLAGVSSAATASSGNNASLRGVSSSLGQPCSYAGLFHESGTSWQDSHDKCTTCECKDGQLCCSYDYRCAGDFEDKRIPSDPPDDDPPGDVPNDRNITRPIVDLPPEGTLSAAVRRPAFVRRDGNGSLLAVTDRARLGNGRRVTDGATVARNPRNDHATSPTGNDDGESSGGLAAGLGASKSPPSDEVPRVSGVSPETLQEPSTRTTTTTTTTTTARTTTSATKTTSSPAPKKAPPLNANSSPVITTDRAVNGFRAFKNLQTARYSTSRALNGRKTSFTSDRRRRPERGPRLVNGNPIGHDATT